MALYNRLRLAELTQLCQDRDLDTSGRKADLIARLLESDAKTDEAVGQGSICRRGCRGSTLPGKFTTPPGERL